MMMEEVSKKTRVKKEKNKPQQPKQFIDGTTYACHTCKTGHRVATCNHGKKKPIAPTNPPGRPAGGSKKKCECPPSCSCTSSDRCTCGGGCICTQKMFLIVHVGEPDTSEPKRSSSPHPEFYDENGKACTLRSVWTDSNGKEISEEEYERRQEVQRIREKGSCCVSKDSTDLLRPPVPQPTGGGCRHRQNIAEVKMQSSTTPDPHKSPHQSSAQCTCGTSCQCTLCPDHPNNEPTRQFNLQQAKTMATSGAQFYMPDQSMMTGMPFRPSMPRQSCMGGDATYFFSRSPNPSQDDLRHLYPNGVPSGIQFAYEVSPYASQDYAVYSHNTNPFILANARFQAFPSANTSLESTMDFSNVMQHDYDAGTQQFSTPSVVSSPSLPLERFHFGQASVNRIPRNAFLSPFIQPQQTNRHSTSPLSSTQSNEKSTCCGVSRQTNRVGLDLFSRDEFVADHVNMPTLGISQDLDMSFDEDNDMLKYVTGDQHALHTHFNESAYVDFGTTLEPHTSNLDLQTSEIGSLDHPFVQNGTSHDLFPDSHGFLEFVQPIPTARPVYTSK